MDVLDNGVQGQSVDVIHDLKGSAAGECGERHHANHTSVSRLRELGHPPSSQIDAVMVIQPAIDFDVVSALKDSMHRLAPCDILSKTLRERRAIARNCESLAMKVKLSGHRVRLIREALGMTVPQFSTVIAVHPGTVHRWESAGDAEVPIDGVAASVLAALDQKVRHRSSPTGDFNPEDVGQQVIHALLVGGALLALGLLIGELVGKGK